MRRALHENELGLRFLSGATAVHDIDIGKVDVAEHSHGCVTLSINLLGGFTSMSDSGTAWITPGSAVLHPAGVVHAAQIGGYGSESIGIEFEPSWLSRVGFQLNVDRTHFWTGGRSKAAARSLAAAWISSELNEEQLARRTAEFLCLALVEAAPPRPRWFDHVREALAADSPPSTEEIAQKLDLHPSWLAQAYRHVAGEGLHDTVRTIRVERAAGLLRFSLKPLAEIATETGFCDQSHMNRCFRAVVGRTPLQVRRDVQRLQLGVHVSDEEVQAPEI